MVCEEILMKFHKKIPSYHQICWVQSYENPYMSVYVWCFNLTKTKKIHSMYMIYIYIHISIWHDRKHTNPNIPRLAMSQAALVPLPRQPVVTGDDSPRQIHHEIIHHIGILGYYVYLDIQICSIIILGSYVIGTHHYHILILGYLGEAISYPAGSLWLLLANGWLFP